jgi:hypothetical protein
VANFSSASDETQIALYESVCRQIQVDMQFGGRNRLVGGSDDALRWLSGDLQPPK